MKVRVRMTVELTDEMRKAIACVFDEDGMADYTRILEYLERAAGREIEKDIDKALKAYWQKQVERYQELAGL